jgi:diguanylate cyclase (GGDEF)-like protein
MRVLVADDDRITRVTLRKLLAQRGYDVVLAKNGSEALNLLSAPDAPLLAILDWMMPGIDGVELCRRIRSFPRGVYTYIIMLTAQGDKTDFRIGMEAGADDYLSKPFDAEELRLRLRAGERIVTLQETLRREARVDVVTNTLNRGAIMGLLQRVVAQAMREQACLAVVLADIDHFKQVNDTYGHPVGDAVLQHVAQTVRSTLRDYDALGRYGGEEFIVVAPGCDSEHAYKVAERIRRAVEKSAYKGSGSEIGVTVSVGAASGVGDQLKPEDLILLADNALYSAKRNGRNRTELAETKPAVFDKPVAKSRKTTRRRDALARSIRRGAP